MTEPQSNDPLEKTTAKLEAHKMGGQAMVFSGKEADQIRQQAGIPINTELVESKPTSTESEPTSFPESKLVPVVEPRQIPPSEKAVAGEAGRILKRQLDAALEAQKAQKKP